MPKSPKRCKDRVPQRNSVLLRPETATLYEGDRDMIRASLKNGPLEVTSIPKKNRFMVDHMDVSTMSSEPTETLKGRLATSCGCGILQKGAHCFCISNWLKASCCPRLEQLNYLPLWWPDLDVTSILLSDLLMWAEQSKVSPFLFRRKMDPPVISFWSCILWILRCPGPAAQYAHLCALLFFTRMLFLFLAAWLPQRTKWRVVWGCFLRFSIQIHQNGLASGMWRLVKYYSLHPEPWICDQNWNQHGGNLCSENLPPKQRNPPWSKTSAWCYFPQYGHRAMIWHFLHLIILQYLKLHGGSNVVAAVHGGWGGGNPSKHFAIAYSYGQKISLH